MVVGFRRTDRAKFMIPKPFNSGTVLTLTFKEAIWARTNDHCHALVQSYSVALSLDPKTLCKLSPATQTNHRKRKRPLKNFNVIRPMQES